MGPKGERVLGQRIRAHNKVQAVEVTQGGVCKVGLAIPQEHAGVATKEMAMNNEARKVHSDEIRHKPMNEGSAFDDECASQWDGE